MEKTFQIRDGKVCCTIKVGKNERKEFRHAVKAAYKLSGKVYEDILHRDDFYIYCASNLYTYVTITRYNWTDVYKGGKI